MMEERQLLEIQALQQWQQVSSSPITKVAPVIDFPATVTPTAIPPSTISAKPPVSQPPRTTTTGSGNSSPTSSSSRSTAPPAAKVQLFNDEVMLRMLQNFTLNTSQHSGGGQGLSSNPQQPTPAPTISLNQIREEQTRRILYGTNSPSPPGVNGPHQPVTGPVNPTSPSSIRRSSSLTNAVAYGAAAGVPPGNPRPVPTQPSVPTNTTTTASSRPSGLVAPATSGLHHSASTSQLRNQFYPTSTSSTISSQSPSPTTTATTTAITRPGSTPVSHSATTSASASQPPL